MLHNPLVLELEIRCCDIGDTIRLGMYGSRRDLLQYNFFHHGRIYVGINEATTTIGLAEYESHHRRYRPRKIEHFVLVRHKIQYIRLWDGYCATYHRPMVFLDAWETFPQIHAMQPIGTDQLHDPNVLFFAPVHYTFTPQLLKIIRIRSLRGIRESTHLRDILKRQVIRTEGQMSIDRPNPITAIFQVPVTS